MSEDLTFNEKEIIRIYREVKSANFFIEKRNNKLTSIEIRQKKNYKEKGMKVDFVDFGEGG